MMTKKRMFFKRSLHVDISLSARYHRGVFLPGPLIGLTGCGVVSAASLFGREKIEVNRIKKIFCLVRIRYDE
ncbi:MAG: hypothetical protein D3911_12875 [Candidatus Electrothrix sp. AW3_4]|nr:hypothetical protein [Candidatus Electrothrix gigas]